MEESHVKGLKILLLVSSLVCLALLLMAAFEENFTAEWRRHQASYADALKTRTVAGAPNVDYPIEVRQVYLESLKRVDRCVTCHVAIDNPEFADAEQPLTAHSGDVLKHHPSDKFGCTVCHLGQGRATVKEDAHGHVSHWPEPMLKGEMVYTSCGHCHYENDLYGGESDLYGQIRPIDHVTRGELDSHVRSAESVARGKRLVIQRGCLGCHTYRGRGGSLGPDITHVGEKTVHDFDFTRVEHGHTVFDWMTAHFKSPQEVVPGTKMPDMGLSDDEARDLAIYMISLKRKSAPAAYTPLPQPVDRTPADGHTLYLMYCSSCHGANGVGAIARMTLNPEGPVLQAIDQPREVLTPSLRNPDTLAVASDDYLRFIIRYGRSGTGMPAWATDGGLAGEEIDRMVAAIRSWQESGPPTESIAARRGNARYGRALYRSRCVGCHGADGRGGVGINLRSPSFLAVASDEFLRDSIIHGRPNTAMPNWPELNADEVSDLLAFLRSWQPEPADRETVLTRLAEQETASEQSLRGREEIGTGTLDKPFLSAGSRHGPGASPISSQSLRVGRILFRSHCANCHAIDGRGSLGPSLRTDEFLSLADNAYLFTAVVHGRPDTAMPAWRHLSSDDVVDLIHHIRTFNDNHRRELEPYLARGDWDRGRILFQGQCAGCHGPSAEGGVGPQLANPTFLDTVSDAMLREWISYGKLGTPMLPFLKGRQGMVELTTSQIEDVVTFLRYNQGRPRAVTARPGTGIAPLGAETYVGTCAGCHGADGEGLVGPALANPHFLHFASDGFLASTIVLGRDGTQMVAMGQGQSGAVEMNEEDLSNVVAFIRSWEHDPPGDVIPRRYIVEADRHTGKTLYTGYCAGCHGSAGNDGWAPALNNPEFLTGVTDGFLQATIARGRSGTAMRSYGRGGGGIAPLTAEQINNIVSYVRTWAPPERRLAVDKQKLDQPDPLSTK